MDVYALTRKERPRNPSMAPIQSVGSNTTASGDKSTTMATMATAATAGGAAGSGTATTVAPRPPSSASSWVSSASSMSSSHISRVTPHGAEQAPASGATTNASGQHSVKGRRSVQGYASWSTGSGASGAAANVQSSLQSSMATPTGVAAPSSHGRARSSLLLGKSVSAGRVATPDIDRTWGEVTGLPTRVHWKVSRNTAGIGVLVAHLVAIAGRPGRSMRGLYVSEAVYAV